MFDFDEVIERRGTHAMKWDMIRARSSAFASAMRHCGRSPAGLASARILRLARFAERPVKSQLKASETPIKTIEA